MHRAVLNGGLVTVAILLAACQDYGFIFQPDANRRGVHLRFSVQTPSKADVLFVIDNSGTMTEKQAALRQSVGELLDELGPNDTSYRIGVVSTDDLGWYADCNGIPYDLPPSYLPTSLDRCSDPGAVTLRRPHDGVKGRLMAAYHAASFDRYASTYSALLNTPEKQDLFAARAPTGATTGPVDGAGAPLSVTGLEGVPWVIDRDIVRADACAACQCDCEAEGFKDSDCYVNCVDGLAAAMVKAYFSSNVEGLGILGRGWEQGIRSSLLAAGIDADLDGDAALAPASSTLKPGGPNRFTDLTSEGPAPDTQWLREEAIFGVMYVSDEEDCSMQSSTFLSIAAREEPEQPRGSGCYQSDSQADLLPATRVADLFSGRKGGRLAFGAIGGVEPTGGGDGDSRYISGLAADCRVDNSGFTSVPSYDCSCMAAVPDDERWCAYTQNQAWPTTQMCEAMAGNRYVDLVSQFPRQTYDSICQSNYGPSLRAFARRLISACFEIDVTMQPAGNNPANIEVIRTPRAEQGPSAEAQSVTRLASCNEAGPGWCYVEPIIPEDTSSTRRVQPPEVCLVGFDRLIGDYYDIFILTTDYYDRSN